VTPDENIQDQDQDQDQIENEEEEMLAALLLLACTGIFTGLGATPDEADLCMDRIGGQEVGATAGDIMRQCAAALIDIREAAAVAAARQIAAAADATMNDNDKTETS
jgi:hypothetical protein